MKKALEYILLSSLLLLSAQTYASCGSAFCMLNTNWSAQGVWTEPGARLDLRYETIAQDELRSGTYKATAGEIAEMDHREIRTQNNNLQATFDYAFTETYGITINAPLTSRTHTHLHVNLDDATNTEREQWDFTNLGDVRVIGRIQLSAATNLHEAYGINLGVKLPTGAYDIANAEGELAERSLQAGTGTTDAIAGAYYRTFLPELNSQIFTQLLLVKPLNKRDEFQAGQQLAWDIGYLYRANKRVNIMAQINYVIKNRDSGAQAEPEESGSKTVSLSPGVSVALSKSTQVYAFVHHRLYQDINGVQLSNKNSFVVGVSTRF
jgi:hypothetical protein